MLHVYSFLIEINLRLSDPNKEVIGFEALSLFKVFVISDRNWDGGLVHGP